MEKSGRIYQSSKYTDTTATSDVVTVVIEDAGFEVDQTASNGFNMVFGKAADVKIADVTVEKVIAVGDSTGTIPMVVSGVTMSEDKKTASVSLFSNFENGATYKISVKGYDETSELVAFVGAPVSMSISSKSGIQNGVLVTINTLTELTYSLFDAQGNDVTNTVSNTNVFFKTGSYNVNDYYVSGNQIYIYKEGVEAVVEAEYHSADKQLKATGYFVGIAENPITITSATLKALKSWGASYPNDTIPLNDSLNQWGQSNVKIEFKVQTNHKDDTYAKEYNTNVKNSIPYLGYEHTIEFRSTNPDVADVVYDGQYDNNGAVMEGDVHVAAAKLRLFKEGTTAILADIVTINSDGSRNVTTITSCYVTVGAKRTYQKIEHFNTNGHLTVGNESGFSTEDLVVLAKDQYGDTLQITDATYTYADGSALEDGAVVYKEYNGGWKNVFTVDGSKFDLGTASSKQFYINVKGKANDAYNSDVQFSFVVTVRAKTNAATTLSVQAWNTMNNGSNVGRYLTQYDGNNNTESAKYTTFKVFEMNNGIKVGQATVAPKTGNELTAANVGKYFYTVECGGVDFTNRDADIVTLAENGKDVILNYSQNVDATMYNDNFTAVTGSAVVYRTDDWKSVGNGTYIFTLYKVEAGSNNTYKYTQVGATTASATLDTESYTFVKRTSEYATYTNSNGYTSTYVAGYGANSPLNHYVLRNCFEIKGRDGNTTTKPYSVKFTDSTNYVFVESITFYEEIETGVYATYTVNINQSLKK